MLQKKFWDELIAYSPWHNTDRIENDASNNRNIVSIVFAAAVTLLPSLYAATLADKHAYTQMGGIYEVWR
jgi:hypothetical protein